LNLCSITGKISENTWLWIALAGLQLASVAENRQFTIHVFLSDATQARSMEELGVQTIAFSAMAAVS